MSVYNRLQRTGRVISRFICFVSYRRCKHVKSIYAGECAEATRQVLEKVRTSSYIFKTFPPPRYYIRFVRRPRANFPGTILLLKRIIIYTRLACTITRKENDQFGWSKVIFRFVPFVWQFSYTISVRAPKLNRAKTIMDAPGTGRTGDFCTGLARMNARRKFSKMRRLIQSQWRSYRRLLLRKE